MKKLKKMISMLVGVAIFILLPGFNTLTVSAEEPVTYCVRYLEDEGAWRYQLGSAWDSDASHRDLYYMQEAMKDGDILVVDGVNLGKHINVSVHLSNLTFCIGSSAVVTANSIGECYTLGNSVAAINGNVTTAYVYDNARCTFNNNVGTLNVLNGPSKTDKSLFGTVTVGGTVDHLIGKDNTRTHYELYNFAAGKLVITEGDIETDDAFFSTTPSATTTTQSTTQTTNQTTTDSSASSDEYDDVPKTGDSNLILLLFGIAAMCFAGRYALKKL